MKLLLKCDRCGVTGNENEIVTNYDDVDLCPECFEKQRLSQMKSEYESKMKWVEETILKGLRELKEQIDKAEASVSKMLN